MLKDVSHRLQLNLDPKFVRKTRMGGHLSNTLKRAGLANAGLYYEAASPTLANQDSRHFEVQPNGDLLSN